MHNFKAILFMLKITCIVEAHLTSQLNPHNNQYVNFNDGDEIGNLKYVRSHVSPKVQEHTAQQALVRILKERSSEIVIKVDPTLTNSEFREAFLVSYNDRGLITISGTTGISAMYGVNDYLKHHCSCLIVWEGKHLSIPSPLPLVTYQKTILDRFRYYQNVCTESYSFVWWNWNRWEKEIDWMALHGINLPLAFTGQEDIWKRVFIDLGLAEEDILTDYMTGPAFLAWWRMGNIGKWGGPISSSFLQNKLTLLHKILRRMRNFGMLPILPCFSGYVPQTITKIFPNVSLIEHSSWNQFNKSYSTFMLQPTDPLFKKIGKLFIDKLINEVGTNHVYSCDTFNENDPSQEKSEIFLKAAAQATYDSMSAGDQKAVWLLQSWAFQSPFWTPPLVEAYLSGIEHGKALILDLEAERKPLYDKYDNFYGHNFIFCMLQNFGGTMNSYGAIDLGISTTRRVSSDKFVGIGSCPEGINQNSVMFEILYEMSTQYDKLNLKDWFLEYSHLRYGVNNSFLVEAWNVLKSGIYNAPANITNHGRSVFIKRPSLKLTEPLWWNLEDPKTVLSLFLKTLNATESLNSSELFKHDLVDFSRQFLQILFSQLYKRLVRSYRKKNVEKFDLYSKDLLEILDDIEAVLQTNVNFLLGNWVRDAESWGESEEERGLLRYNALNQITLWGPNGEISDYAAKQWAGTVGMYYKPRWRTFFTFLNVSLHSEEPFSYKRFRKYVLQNIEIPFTLSLKQFPIHPTGDTIEETQRIYRKWNKLFSKVIKKIKN